MRHLRAAGVARGAARPQGGRVPRSGRRGRDGAAGRAGRAPPPALDAPAGGGDQQHARRGRPDPRPARHERPASTCRSRARTTSTRSRRPTPTSPPPPRSACRPPSAWWWRTRPAALRPALAAGMRVDRGARRPHLRQRLLRLRAPARAPRRADGGAARDDLTSAQRERTMPAVSGPPMIEVRDLTKRSAPSTPCAASLPASGAARWSASSDRTAPARRPPCASSPGIFPPDVGRGAGRRTRRAARAARLPAAGRLLPGVRALLPGDERRGIPGASSRALKRLPRAARPDAVDARARRLRPRGGRAGVWSARSAKGFRQRVGLAQALLRRSAGPHPRRADLGPRPRAGGRDPRPGEEPARRAHGLLLEPHPLRGRAARAARGHHRRAAGWSARGPPGGLARRSARASASCCASTRPAGESPRCSRACPASRLSRPTDGALRDRARRGDGARGVAARSPRRGWALLELRRETLALEEIFLRLVQRAASARRDRARASRGRSCVSYFSSLLAYVVIAVFLGSSGSSSTRTSASSC